MTFKPTNPQPESSPRKPPQLDLTRIIGGTVLLAVLTMAGTYLFGGLSGVSTAGVIALVLGVTFSYALGVGLMVAVFHSSRFHDDSAHDAARNHFKERHEDP